MPGPWIVDQIQLADNQELFFEAGVVVEAKRGAFRGRTDSLFSAWNKTNVQLTGYGATLRMHRDDYDGPDYDKAEWRHVLSFRGCTNVTVLGLTLTESGGDGIYLGAGRNRQTNRNVVIRDVVCDRNYRQGISVITAENLLIENCVLKNTAGTAPAAGIDFEPNHASERLVNCVMRNCVIEDNQGLGIHLYLRPLNGTSEPVSIRIENCITRGTNATSASVITSCGPEGPVQGTIEFVNCRFADHGRAGIRIGSKPPEGLQLRFVDCTIADPSDQPALSAPISFSTRPGDLQTTGGVEFANLTVHERVERPLMVFHDVIGANLRDITGSITVRRDGQETTHALDPQVVSQWVPYDRVLDIPVTAWQAMRLVPIVAEPPAAAENCRTTESAARRAT
jgi:polygalacturonase